MKKSLVFLLAILLFSRAFSEDWVVCMGSFRDYKNAHERLHALSVSDIPVFIAEHKKGDDELFFRVIYSDYFDTASDAEKMRLELLKRQIVKKLKIFDLWCCKKEDHVLSPALPE